MNGFSGVISFDLSTDEIREKSDNLFASLIPNKFPCFSNSMHIGNFLTFDKDSKNQCRLETKDHFVLISGEIFDDSFLSQQDITKAQYLLDIFLKQGPSGCISLNGSYAFILYDIRHSTIYIGTDKNSITPVYYYKQHNCLLLSWDTHSLLQSSGQPAQLNWNNLFTWLLIGGRGFGDETRFENIKRLEPGSFLTISKTQFYSTIDTPFHFIGDETNKPEDLLEEAQHKIEKALQRRLKNYNNVLFGLSGGIDSRIVLSAVSKEDINKITSYTYGVKDFIEKQIAKQVASLFGINNIDIEYPDDIYMEFAGDGVFYASGASLFKHGVQPHMFAALDNIYHPQGILFGSALDLVLGGTFASQQIHQLTHRNQLFEYYKSSLFNMKRQEFVQLFQKQEQGNNFFDSALETIDQSLNKIPGENPANVNDAFAFDVRIKRWYNHNLVYPLHSHRLLTPTYDLDFLDLVSRVPALLRKDSLFRTQLLNKINPQAANIVYDDTMQPAWLLPPYTRVFAKMQKELEQKQLQLWYESNQSVYLPSRKYDANFLEWFRVYPRYQEYLHNTLLSKDAYLSNNLLRPERIQELIDQHIQGKKTNHKILVMLLSSEILCQIYLKGNLDLIHNLFVDFSKYIKH